MSETTKLLGVLAVGAALGAGGVTASKDTFDTSARPIEVRFLPDGQTAVTFQTAIGDCVSAREVVYGVDGGVRMNGRPTDDATITAFASAVAQAKAAAASIDKGVADGVLEVRFLGDGQTALTLTRQVDGGRTYAELVVDADGGTPRLGGVPIVEEATLKAVSDASRALKLEAATVDTSTLTKPIDNAAAAGKFSR